MSPAELSSDDRLSIMDLLARYARCLDSGDLDGYVSLFTPDAVLFGEHKGRDNIRAYVDTVIQRRATEGAAARKHFVGLPTIDGTNERVTVHSYLMWVRFGSDSPAAGAAEYNDVCVRVDGRWRFQSRVLNRT
jgi:uncharacterized protein (TIGR02246 family)